MARPKGSTLNTMLVLPGGDCSTARDSPSPLNAVGIEGDVGPLMEEIERQDPGRVPVAVIRAGRGFVVMTFTQDAPHIRRELAGVDVPMLSGHALEVLTGPPDARRKP